MLKNYALKSVSGDSDSVHNALSATLFWKCPGAKPGAERETVS